MIRREISFVPFKSVMQIIVEFGALDEGDDGFKVENTKMVLDIHIFMKLYFEIRSFTPSYSLVPSVYSITYSSLPSSASFNLNSAPAETSSSAFLVNITVFESDVVISLVLFLAIIMTETTSEIREMPKAIYKTQQGKVK